MSSDDVETRNAEDSPLNSSDPLNFRQEWAIDRPWLTSKDGRAFCEMCSRHCVNRITHIKRHENTAIHKTSLALHFALLRNAGTPEPEPRSPRTSASAARSSASGPRSSAPGPRSSAPGPRSSAPGPRSSYPAPKSVAPPPRSSAPPPRSSAPAPKSSAPAPRSVGPSPKSSAPALKSSAPAPRSVAPSPRSSAPAPKLPHASPASPQSDEPLTIRKLLASGSPSPRRMKQHAPVYKPQHFRHQWCVNRPWLIEKNYRAFCKVCSKYCTNRITHIVRHGHCKEHQKRMSGSKWMNTFIVPKTEPTTTSAATKQQPQHQKTKLSSKPLQVPNDENVDDGDVELASIIDRETDPSTVITKLEALSPDPLQAQIEDNQDENYVELAVEADDADEEGEADEADEVDEFDESFEVDEADVVHSDDGNTVCPPYYTSTKFRPEWGKSREWLINKGGCVFCTVCSVFTPNRTAHIKRHESCSKHQKSLSYVSRADAIVSEFLREHRLPASLRLALISLVGELATDSKIAKKLTVFRTYVKSKRLPDEVGQRNTEVAKHVIDADDDEGDGAEESDNPDTADTSGMHVEIAIDNDDDQHNGTDAEMEEHLVEESAEWHGVEDEEGEEEEESAADELAAILEPRPGRTRRNVMTGKKRGPKPAKEPRVHACAHCGNVFANRSSLVAHERLHSGIKPYACDECGRAFSRWADLQYHVTSLHTDLRQFQCEFCGKEFARRYSLILHRRIHTGERNYKCEWCDKTFRASNYLQNHRRIHTGEKPHECEYCGKRFRMRTDMKKHWNLHRKKGQAGGGGGGDGDGRLTEVIDDQQEAEMAANELEMMKVETVEVEDVDNDDVNENMLFVYEEEVEEEAEIIVGNYEILDADNVEE